MGELVERAGASGNGEAPIAEIDIVELQGADRAGAGCMDGGQREDQAVGWASSTGGCALDLTGFQRLDELRDPVANPGAEYFLGFRITLS